MPIEFKNCFKFVQTASYNGGDFCTTNEKINQMRTSVYLAVITMIEEKEELPNEAAYLQ